MTGSAVVEPQRSRQRSLDARSGALDIGTRHRSDRDRSLTGSTDAETIWIDDVPEPEIAQHRTHLDT